ncbi:imelysin family protein [Vibrio sp. NTOU-M3]|uniref:imelysin family protein n=1 Tax=Vibrio sp. NTOU-M3 TaxID=3234954 RepID=UPI0035A9869A
MMMKLMSSMALLSAAVMSAQTHANVHSSHQVYLVEQQAAQAFSKKTENLASVFADFCATERSDSAPVTQAWHQAMLSWMALQGQERGPVAALEQSWNIQFWPDKKNTTGRKMAALIRQDREWLPDDISQQSVTVQGLGAIEWLLYDPASDLQANSKTCKTGTVIAQNLQNNAKAIALAWKENPWQALDQAGWYAEYIALLSNQLDYSMKKLSRPMAKIGKPRPYFSESWRSQTSLSNLKSNVVAMEKLYLANGKGLDAILRARGKIQLADSIKTQFATVLETWPSQSSLFGLLKSKPGYQTVMAQFNKLEQLNYLIHEEVAIELGVVIGFNATDGD